MVNSKPRHRLAIDELHSISTNEEEARCGHSPTEMPQPPRYACGAGEGLAMTLTRFILAGQLHGDGACYEAAYQAAERALDLPDAVELVAHVTCLVLAIRRERNGVFHFLPPNCSRITRDERDLLSALRSAIDDDHTALQGTLSLLARGQAGRCTGLALSRLAQALVHFGLASEPRRSLQ